MTTGHATFAHFGNGKAWFSNGKIWKQFLSCPADDTLMTREEKTAERIRQAEEEIPRKGTSDTAFVRCVNVECLGMKGPDGIWRDTYGNVLEVVKIISEL